MSIIEKLTKLLGAPPVCQECGAKLEDCTESHTGTCCVKCSGSHAHKASP